VSVCVACSVLQELAQDEAEDKPTVFASDAVVAHLMAASRAVNPWYGPRRTPQCGVPATLGLAPRDATYIPTEITAHAVIVDPTCPHHT
jgi:hypothetical protein